MDQRSLADPPAILRHMRLIEGMMLLSGNQLGDRVMGSKRLSSCINIFLKTLMVSACSVEVYFWMDDLLGSRRTRRAMTTPVILFSGLVSVCSMSHRRSRLTRLISQVTMDAETAKRVQQMSRSVVMMTILLLTPTFVCFVLLISRRLGTTVAATYGITSVPLALNQYSISSALLYQAMVQLVTDHEMTMLRELQLQLISGDPLNICQVTKSRQEVMDMKKELESLMNLIPFQLLSILFFTLPSAVTTFNNVKALAEGIAIQAGIFFACLHALVLIIALMTILRVSKCTLQVNEGMTRVIRLLQLTVIERNGDWEAVCAARSLIQRLHQERRFRYTGYCLLIIDHRLILSFLSAIVSFTVLLIQFASRWL